MEKLQMVDGVTERWEEVGLALNFFEDTRLLPVRQKSMGRLAESLVKANTLWAMSQTLCPQTGTQCQYPRGQMGSSSIIPLMASCIFL